MLVMEEKWERIYREFGPRLVGNQIMKGHICEVVALLPDKTIDFITRKCWFLGSLDDAWAFTFTGNDLKDQHLIFLSDELLLEDSAQIDYTIAHEIGHVILNHRNSVVVKQSKAEIFLQEEQADEFARKYLEAENY